MCCFPKSWNNYQPEFYFTLKAQNNYVSGIRKPWQNWGAESWFLDVSPQTRKKERKKKGFLPSHLSWVKKCPQEEFLSYKEGKFSGWLCIYWIVENSFISRFNFLAGEPRGEVLDNSFTGGICKTVKSIKASNPYRVPANLEDVNFEVGWPITAAGRCQWWFKLNSQWKMSSEWRGRIER